MARKNGTSHTVNGIRITDVEEHYTTNKDQTTRAEKRVTTAVQRSARRAVGALATKYGKGAGSGSLRSALCEKCDQHTVHKHGTCIYCGTSAAVGTLPTTRTVPGMARGTVQRVHIPKWRYAQLLTRAAFDRKHAARAAAEESRKKWEGANK